MVQWFTLTGRKKRTENKINIKRLSRNMFCFSSPHKTDPLNYDKKEKQPKTIWNIKTKINTILASTLHNRYIHIYVAAPLAGDPGDVAQ